MGPATLDEMGISLEEQRQRIGALVFGLSQFLGWLIYPPWRGDHALWLDLTVGAVFSLFGGAFYYFGLRWWSRRKLATTSED